MKQLLLVLALLILGLPTSGYAQDFYIENFNSELILQENGDIAVTEIIDVVFNQKRRGIFRTIPYRYTINGKGHTTSIKNISVDDTKFSTKKKNGNLEIKIGDKNIFVQGKQQYTIHYTIEKAFVAYENWQELYWNVTGNDWPTVIENASVRVRLPNAHAFSTDERIVYTGSRGSTSAKASMDQIDARTVVAQTSNSLQTKEGMTIALKFPAGYIPDAPSMVVVPWTERPGINGPIGALIPVGLIGFILSFWRQKRKTSYEKTGIELQYDAPEGITSAHAGVLIDRKVDTRDLISLIPFWGTEGFLYMHDIEGDILLEKIKDLPADFPVHERDFFNALFKTGNKVNLDTFKEKFYSTLYKLKVQLGKEIRKYDYYDESYAVVFKKWYWYVLCVLIVVAGINVLLFTSAVVLGIGLIATGVLSTLLSVFRTPLNEKGYLFRQKLLGLKAFLSDPPEEKVQALLEENPAYFERMLPFAVAFDLDKKWMDVCAPYIEEAPLWYIQPYYGVGQTTPFTDFSESFQPAEITSAFSSYPSSSGSGGGGGSFGGGSSGGGFGGGGGGSW